MSSTPNTQSPAMDVDGQVNAAEKPEARLRRLQKSTATGVGAQKRVRDAVVKDTEDDVVDHVESTYSTAEETYWSDAILDAVTFYVANFSDKQENWVLVFEGIHATWCGYVPGNHFLYCIIACLQHSDDPYSLDRTRNFGFEWPALNGRKEILVADVESAERIKNFLSTLPNTDRSIKIDAFGSKEGAIVKTNDQIFRSWYSKPENLAHAQRFFFASVVTFLRAFVRQHKTTYKHVQGRIWMTFGQFFSTERPDVIGHYNEAHFDVLSSFFNQRYSFTRGVIKCVLHSFTAAILEYSGKEASAFFDYAIKINYRYQAFHVLKNGDKVRADYGVDIHGFRDLIESTGLPDAVAQYQNYLKTKKMMYEYIKHPELTVDGVTYTFYYWPYARYFEGTCFLRASVYKNAWFIGVCVGLLPEGDQEASKIFGLQKYMSEYKTAFEAGRKVRNRIKKYREKAPRLLPATDTAVSSDDDSDTESIAELKA